MFLHILLQVVLQLICDIWLDYLKSAQKQGNYIWLTLICTIFRNNNPLLRNQHFINHKSFLFLRTKYSPYAREITTFLNVSPFWINHPPKNYFFLSFCFVFAKDARQWSSCYVWIIRKWICFVIFPLCFLYVLQYFPLWRITR